MVWRELKPLLDLPLVGWKVEGPPRVPGNVKFTAVYGNEGILAPKPFRRETKVKLREDMSEGFGKELGPLLDEGGSRGDFIGKEIKIFQ